MLPYKRGTSMTFSQVLLTRAGLLSAVNNAAAGALSEREVANAVFEALGFHRDDPAVRAEYMQQPELKGNTRRQVQEAMRGILGYRSYFDLRRGWRFNNPNLEQLGLVRIAYQDLNDLAGDASEWSEAPQALQAAEPAERAEILRHLFDFMRQGLCIASRYLDRTELATASHPRVTSYLPESLGVSPRTSVPFRPVGSSHLARASKSISNT